MYVYSHAVWGNNTASKGHRLSNKTPVPAMGNLLHHRPILKAKKLPSSGVLLVLPSQKKITTEGSAD